MLKIGSIVWGVRDMARAIRFWSLALDYRLLREPDVDWAILVSNNGAGPRLAIKLVSSEAEDHQRHHLDLFATDKAAEIERLIGLGAEHVDRNYEAKADHVVLADPDGNRVCVIQDSYACLAPPTLTQHPDRITSSDRDRMPVLFQGVPDRGDLPTNANIHFAGKQCQPKRLWYPPPPE